MDIRPLFLWFILSIIGFGWGETVDLGQEQPARAPAAGELADTASLARMRSSHVSAASAYPTLSWPIQAPLDQQYLISNYADHDQSPAIADHNGLPHTYDGHNGTDLSTSSFRYMDRGIEVIAAAPGTVRRIVFDQYDRNLSWEDEQQWNAVYIEHVDGSEAWYGHLRTSSVVVNEAESVQRGQLLGLMGSSGRSSVPHLHLELGRFDDESWTWRSPWQGSSFAEPSLWESQPPHAAESGFNPLDVHITTEQAIGGDIDALNSDSLKKHPLVPAVIGTGEPMLIFWFRYQCPDQGSYSYEIRRPDGSLWGSNDYVLDGHRKGSFRYTWRTWDSRVNAADDGTWSLALISEGAVKASTSFEVGAETVYQPRFWPLNGRSFRLTGQEIRDTLRVHQLCAPSTFALADEAPACVSLTHDSIIVIAPAPKPLVRSTRFEAYAVDEHGRKDTMWYHMVAPDQPHELPTIARHRLERRANMRNQSASLPLLKLIRRNNRLEIAIRDQEAGAWYDLAGRFIAKPAHLERDAVSPLSPPPAAR